MRAFFLFCAIFFAPFFALTSALNAAPLGKLEIKIPKQDSETLKIPAFDLKVGESGIITRQNDKNAFIIANVRVKSIQDGVATLETTPFSALAQKYTPKPKGSPREGDLIIFRILYSRALLIAPNQNAYQALREGREGDFVHSDVFAAFLAQNGANLPQPADFARFCETYQVGLVVLALKNTALTLDCQSFKILSREDFTLRESSQKLPFFTRLSDKTTQELFNLDAKMDYFAHFTRLIEEQNPTIGAQNGGF